MKYLKKTTHKKVGKQVIGSHSRPRLCVTKSNKHIYAQVINDYKNQTLCAASTLDPEIRSQLVTTSTCLAGKLVGHAIATKSIKSSFHSVIFDKRNYPYHGKIQAVAEAAREAGLNF
uniref:Large ribosomal subunit protein uL18c n=1 Tax=Apophlaea sinclairii TaxID=212746 RepID=A0A1C9CBY6_9FLOR|nr:ribosomal protein L18 [Apophlaea sinclairii]AOM65864.1 ribosomal protein L18 [Apophlaea sinclairii]